MRQGIFVFSFARGQHYMNNNKNWWRDSIGYIIYPESFKDSNGDGIGDIQGIISKLDYLHDLGVNLLWICPLFDSPMDDNGYDVSDYYRINPRFGTNEDFKTLLEEAHRRDIRILIDFVLNHTSDEHPWFQMALRNENSKERGYYFFRKGKRDENGELLPPNNWKGFFATSAWKQVEGSDDFYLHIFSEKMPDVNWGNPELRERYYEIARFYLDMGVDGFRLDALAHLAKDLSFSDSDKEADASGLVLDTDKFSNRPELFAYLAEFKEKVFSHYDCLTVGEVGGEISPQNSLLFSDREKGSINMVFNFDTVWDNGAYGSIDKTDEEIRTNLIELKQNFKKWYDVCHEHADMPLYWCNHDHPRVLSQYGDVRFRNESAKMLLTTLLFMYGTPFIYNGDEIGMSNVRWEKPEDFYGDVGNKNSVKYWRRQGYSEEEIVRFLNRSSRINARTPFQWENAPYAGFSNVEPFERVNDNYKEGVNALDEMNDPWSIINFSQYAIYKRRLPEIKEIIDKGSWDILDIRHPDVFAYMHEYNGQRLIVVSNFRPYNVFFSFYYRIHDVILHNYDNVLLDDHVFTLRPFECFLLKV